MSLAILFFFKLIITYHVLNNRKYDQILSQFKITGFFHHISATQADLTSMKMSRYCT